MWRQLAGVMALVGIGCAAVAGLHIVMTRPVDPKSPKRDFVVDPTNSDRDVLRMAMAKLLNSGMTSDGSDVVVWLQSPGSLIVFGKGLSAPCRLASLDELKDLLRTLPQGNTATVLVARQSTSSAPSEQESIKPADLAGAERAIKAMLQESGFHDVRSGVVSREIGAARQQHEADAGRARRD